MRVTAPHQRDKRTLFFLLWLPTTVHASMAFFTALTKRIASEEVIQIPGFGTTMLPGAKGFRNGEVYRLNASYLPLQLFIRLDHELPNGPWQQIAAKIPDLVGGSSPSGFASDWA